MPLHYLKIKETEKKRKRKIKSKKINKNKMLESKHTMTTGLSAFK